MGKSDKARRLATGRPGGGVQDVRTRRKLFGKQRRKIFLEHLAATCNVRRSAAAAGVTDRCVYKCRMRDAGFRAEWQAALEQGYARLEAMLLEHAMRERPIEIDGALEAEPPTTGDGRFDADLALHLLREHKKGLAGIARPGAAPRGADWSEVEAYFVRRLKALKVRLDREDEPLHDPRGEPGEDR